MNVSARKPTHAMEAAKIPMEVFIACVLVGPMGIPSQVGGA